MQQLEWIPKGIVLTEKINPKRLCTIWFHLCNSLHYSNGEKLAVVRDKNWKGGRTRQYWNFLWASWVLEARHPHVQPCMLALDRLGHLKWLRLQTDTSRLQTDTSRGSWPWWCINTRTYTRYTCTEVNTHPNVYMLTNTGEIWISVECINVNFLVALCYCHFTKCYHWGD